MPIDILMPALSPTMEEGTLSKWLVKEGDTVSAGDLLAEIETDKATMEFEAVDEGVIGKIIVAEGTEGVRVNTPIATLLDEAGDGPSDGAASDAASKADGTTEQEPQKGYGVEPGGADLREKRPNPDTPSRGDQMATDRVFATPVARRLARDRNLDLRLLRGSGPKGRIIKSDVISAPSDVRNLGAVDDRSTDASPHMESEATLNKTDPASSADPIKQIYSDRHFEEVKLDGMRRTIASRLTEAKQTIPHFYLRRDVRLDALIAFRMKLNEGLSERGIKLSINDFVIKACAVALQQFPAANAVWAGDKILRFLNSDVAVAVAVDGGLYTPVIRNAELKSLTHLSKEMKGLVEKARNRKLAPGEYAGGSFAISNLGMYGIDSFDAVINPPHAAILAVGAAKSVVTVAEGGAVDTAEVMTTTLSVDHRVIDGVLGARLLDAIVRNLENPIFMLA